MLLCEENDAKKILHYSMVYPRLWLAPGIQNFSAGLYYHAYGYFTSSENESVLSEDDVALFKPICRKLNLPVQHPISVCLLKRISVPDSVTGRMIDYWSSNESDISFNVISITSWSTATHVQFGMIKNLFAYRGMYFTITDIFMCPVQNFDGIMHITDCNNSSQAVIPLVEISRPHVIAIEQLPQIYILNF